MGIFGKGFISVIGGGGAPAFEPEYQAVLDYAITEGFAQPSSTQKVLQNELLRSLKVSGIWNKLDSFAVFATDASASFALIDWVNLTTMTAVNSPVFTLNTGFETNGTSSYIDTLKVPGPNFTLNSASIFYYINNPLSASTSTIFQGATSTTGGSKLFERNGINCAINSSVEPTFTSNANAGLRIINRPNNTEIERIINGVSETQLSSSLSLVDRKIFSGCVNAGFPSSFEVNKISFFGIGASLSIEAPNLLNSINSYLASL